MNQKKVSSRNQINYKKPKKPLKIKDLPPLQFDETEITKLETTIQRLSNQLNGLTTKYHETDNKKRKLENTISQLHSKAKTSLSELPSQNIDKYKTKPISREQKYRKNIQLLKYYRVQILDQINNIEVNQKKFSVSKLQNKKKYIDDFEEQINKLNHAIQQNYMPNFNETSQKTTEFYYDSIINILQELHMNNLSELFDKYFNLIEEHSIILNTINETDQRNQILKNQNSELQNAFIKLKDLVESISSDQDNSFTSKNFEKELFDARTQKPSQNDFNSIFQNIQQICTELNFDSYHISDFNSAINAMEDISKNL